MHTYTHYVPVCLSLSLYYVISPGTFYAIYHDCLTVYCYVVLSDVTLEHIILCYMICSDML